MQQSSSLRSALLVLVGAVAVTALQAPAPSEAKAPRRAPPAAQPLKVAVVDIGRLFAGYARKASFEKELNDDRDAFKRELLKERAKLKKLRDALLKRSDKGSDEWLKLRAELKQAETRWQTAAKKQHKSLKGRIERSTLQLLKEVEGTIRRWGKAQDLDLVFKVDRTSALAGLDTRFRDRIFHSQVSDLLHYKAALDRTSDVLRVLNDPENLKRFKPRQGDH